MGEFHFHALGEAAGAFVERALRVQLEILTPPGLEDPNRMPEHRALVRSRLGVEIDCPEFASLASRWGALLRAHNVLAAAAADALAGLLVEQQQDRRDLLEKSLPRLPGRSYAHIAAEVAHLYRSGHRPLLDGDEPLAQTGPEGRGEIATDGLILDHLLPDYENETARVIAALHQIAEHSREREAILEAALGASDKLLATIASRIAAATEAHGDTGERDWEATVAILEFWGWDLGPGPLQSKIDRLRKKVERWEASRQPVDC